MTDPVSVPLSRLRVMPPQGAPCLKAPEGAGIPSMIRDGEPLLFVRGEHRGETGASWAVVLHGDTVEWLPARAVTLDLTAPAASRIDGATVAATMLAEAAGLDVSRGVCWFADRDDPFDKGRGAVVIRTATGSAIRRYSERTDATDPRAILAAVLVAVLGVDRE